MLVEQLRHNPASHFAAALEGGPQFIGWDADRYLLADTRDLLLAIASGLAGQKIAPADLYARPEDTREVRVATIADFDVDAFMRRL